MAYLSLLKNRGIATGRVRLDELFDPPLSILDVAGKGVALFMAGEIAKVARPWFRNIEIFSESVAHCESHGIRDKGTVVEHTYLLMS